MPNKWGHNLVGSLQHSKTERSSQHKHGMKMRNWNNKKNVSYYFFLNIFQTFFFSVSQFLRCIFPLSFLLISMAFMLSLLPGVICVFKFSSKYCFTSCSSIAVHLTLVLVLRFGIFSTSSSSKKSYSSWTSSAKTKEM